MELEKRVLHASTVEGYRVLLRAEAELLLPREYARISAFYLALAEKCISWITEVTGERIRARYLQLPTTLGMARFRTCSYRFRMRWIETDARHSVILCESELDGAEESAVYRRLAHVWYLTEETILPHSQVLRLYAQKKQVRAIGFRPDGVYPEDGALVFFKNATPSQKFLEKKYAIYGDGK